MYYLGIDLGGTNVASGVVNESYEIIAKASVPTEVSKGADAIVSNIALSAKKAVENAGLSLSDISGVGIGTPGACNVKDGIVDFANNLNFDHFPLAELVSKKLDGIKVYIDNDANVAALAEHKAGAAKGTTDSTTITLGTGVGGGMVINDKIYSGFNYKGGELGHIVIVKDGEPCSCGRRGCWEAYASVTALIRQTKAEMLNDKNSLMWELSGGLDGVSGRTAFDAMKKGDRTAIYVVEQYIRYISIGLADIINILQPEIIVIGGAISKEGDYILEPLKRFVKPQMYSRFSDTMTEIRMAQLHGDAGIIGAALISM